MSHPAEHGAQCCVIVVPESELHGAWLLMCACCYLLFPGPPAKLAAVLMRFLNAVSCHTAGTASAPMCCALQPVQCIGLPACLYRRSCMPCQTHADRPCLLVVNSRSSCFVLFSSRSVLLPPFGEQQVIVLHAVQQQVICCCEQRWGVCVVWPALLCEVCWSLMELQTLNTTLDTTVQSIQCG